jgi:hypothetical protein
VNWTILRRSTGLSDSRDLDFFYPEIAERLVRGGGHEAFRFQYRPPQAKAIYPGWLGSLSGPFWRALLHVDQVTDGRIDPW